MDGSEIMTIAGVGLGSLGAGAGIVSVIGKSVIENAVKKAIDLWMQKQLNLEVEVKTLRDEKVAGLERRMSGVEQNCLHHQDNTAIAELRTTTTELQKAAARFESTATGISREVATATAKLEAVEGFVRDVRTEGRELRREFAEHARDGKIHGGRG